MRTSCTDCCRKHLAQALVISHELQWYADNLEDNHLWVCVGHLAEAEAQIQKLSPFIADRIRDQRLLLMNEGSGSVGDLQINQLINMVCELVESTHHETSPLGDIPDMDSLADLRKITKRSE